MLSRIILFIACLSMAAPGMSQVGHPAKGSWSGYMGVDSENRQRIRLLIESHNGELTTTINPGRRAVESSGTELDAPNWEMVIEADMPDGKLVMTGTLSNLGSWTNRKYIGTYSLGSEEGSFTITLN